MSSTRKRHKRHKIRKTNKKRKTNKRRLRGGGSPNEDFLVNNYKKTVNQVIII